MYFSVFFGVSGGFYTWLRGLVPCTGYVVLFVVIRRCSRGGGS